MKVIQVRKDDICVFECDKDFLDHIYETCSLIYDDGKISVYMNIFKVVVIGSVITIYYTGTKEYEFFKALGGKNE